MNTIGRNASGEYLPQPPRSSKPPDLGALRLVIAKLSRRITLAEQTMSDLMDLVSNLHEAGMTRRPECSPPRGKRRCNTQVAESPSTADHMQIVAAGPRQGKLLITLTHEIPLRPREALLVDILLQAGDGLETTPDGLLPWMNVETVLNLLAARTGKRCSRGALTTMIYRIREKLEACGLSDGLLATDGKLGIRLAARLGQAREIREAIRIIGDLPKAQDPPTLLPLSETSALPV